MNTYLEKAKAAMERQGRMGGQPKREDILDGMRQAIEEMLKYLQELDLANSSKRP